MAPLSERHGCDYCRSPNSCVVFVAKDPNVGTNEPLFALANQTAHRMKETCQFATANTHIFNMQSQLRQRFFIHSFLPKGAVRYLVVADFKPEYVPNFR
jgi:hypothetical protein